MNFKELLEKAGVENSQDVADQISTAIQEAVQAKQKEMEDTFQVKLAEALVRVEEAAEAKKQAELEQEKTSLLEWHTFVIQQELAEVDNSLKVAAEVKKVRSGLEKVMEGMKEAGLNITQVFESAVASEVIAMQDQVQALEEALAEANNRTKAFQRAFVVAEATRGMKDTKRDAVIDSADKIDESIEISRFKSLVELIKESKEMEDKVKDKEVDEEDDDEDEKDGKKKKVEEGYSSNNPFERANPSDFTRGADISQFFK